MSRGAELDRNGSGIATNDLDLNRTAKLTFMFSIGFGNEADEYPYDDVSVPAAAGSLILGKCTEDFLANLSLWSRSDYERHWKRELNSILQGRPRVALVVSYDDPKASSNLEIWRVYRDEDWLYFQNQLLWYSSLPRSFEIAELSRFIPERSLINEDGNRISEWKVPVRDLETFLWRSGAI